MNPVKTAYCRLFQMTHRPKSPFRPCRLPETLDSVREIPEKLKQLGIPSVLLVTNAALRSLGVTGELEATLKRTGLRCAVYADTPAYPTLSGVETALDLYHGGNCGALIGFGGGSCIDCAKAVGVRIARPDRTLRQLEGVHRVRGKLPPLFAVPTTAGSGSEATLSAFVEDEQARRLISLSDSSLMPRYAVLDTRATSGLPPHFTAATGLEALARAVEAYLGRTATREARTDALDAVRLICTYLERAFRNGGDMEARRELLRASYLAGAALTKSGAGYCRCIAGTLGGRYHIPHSLANAVLFPYVLRACGSSVWRDLKRVAIAAGAAEAAIPASAAAERFIRSVEAMERRMGIPNRFPEIRAEDIPELAARADREGNPACPVPRLMDAAELERFYVMTAVKL